MRLLGILAGVAVAFERLVRPRTKFILDDVHCILVLQYRIPLGNCIHMTPLFEAIKRERPDIKVVVATHGLGIAVLRNSPYVDELIETPDVLKDFWGARSSLVRHLEQKGLNPDCCLTGVADQRTKIGLLAASVCSGWRGGFTLVPTYYQRPLQYDKSVSLIANNLRLASLIGRSSEFPEPKVFYSPADAEVARKLLEPAFAGGRPVLVVNSCNSGGLPQAWHEDRWADTIRFAHTVLGYSIVYVGIASDAPKIDALIELAGDIGTSLAGATTINQLAAVIALSDMVVTIDSGGMHVTRSVGTPMVLLGLAWEKPLQWLATGRPHIRILRGPELEKAPPGYRMDEISVDWVTQELAEMTKLFPQDEAAREARLKASLSDIDLLLR